MCERPLRLLDTVIEHVVPKSLSGNPARLAQVREELGLPDTFDVHGFENLLPSCVPCNLKKAKRVFNPSAKIQLHLELLAGKADAVRRSAEAVRKNVATDRVLQAIFSALEQKTISMVDLEKLLADITRIPQQVGVPSDVVILDDGYWYKRTSIVAEGPCRCERETCVGADRKIYCYFHDELPVWVISAGLYHRCYDEIVPCPRCARSHKRGHIGRVGLCGKPFPAEATRTA